MEGDLGRSCGRIQIRTLLIVPAASLSLALVIGCMVTFREVGEQIRDAYCLDWASAAIVQHLNDNKGRYPANWDDLKPAFDKVTAQDKSFSFDEVRSRVQIDFDVSPAATADANQRFLRLRSGRGVRWGSPDPEGRIRSRLREQLKE